MNNLYPALIECDTQLFQSGITEPNYYPLYLAITVLALCLVKNKKTI